MRFRRTIPCVIVASGVGSLLAGILGLTLYMPGAMSNFLFFTGYLSGGTAHLVKLIVCAGTSFVLGAVFAYLFGISKEELAEMDSEPSAGAVAQGCPAIGTCVASCLICEVRRHFHVLDPAMRAWGAGHGMRKGCSGRSWPPSPRPSSATYPIVANNGWFVSDVVRMWRSGRYSVQVLQY